MVSAAIDHPLILLHLEDSLLDHELTVRQLRKAGVVCQWLHTDTLEGFQHLLATHRVDAIIADYHLPGFTALDAWALLPPGIESPPFLLLSGAIGEAAAVEIMRQGIADYVFKQDLERLPRVLLRTLEGREAERARDAAQAELQRSQQRLAELTEHLQTSIERERAAIAREIHDDIGGSLTAIRFDLAWIGRHCPPQAPGIQERSRSATAMLQNALESVQRILKNLRPPVLDQGLVEALEWLQADFERRTGIAVQWRAPVQLRPMRDDLTLTAYRTAQEALTNVAKYAQARQVTLELSDAEEVLTLEIRDDGCGMPAGTLERSRGFGLKGLHERARLVGGWLDVASREGQGTTIVLTVPLEPMS